MLWGLAVQIKVLVGLAPHGASRGAPTLGPPASCLITWPQLCLLGHVATSSPVYLLFGVFLE